MIHAAQKLLDSNEEEDEEEEEEQEVEVEKILDKKEQYGEILYLIKWIGFPESENTWEPKKNLINCKQMLSEFERELKDKGKKPQERETESKPLFQEKCGHFEFGDKLKKIIKEKVNSEDRLILELSWEKRPNGIAPKNSVMYSEVLKKHCPLKFAEYLESRLMDMEIIMPVGNKTTADSSREDDDSLDGKMRIKKKIKIPLKEDSVIALDSELNESP